MTDELYGKEGVEAGLGYEPMPPANPPPEEDANIELAKGAFELNKKREAEDRPIDPISYHQTGGDHAGDLSPENQTVSAERAAEDLAAYRNAHDDAKEAQADHMTAEVVDALRQLRQQQLSPAQQPVEAPPVETQQPESQPQIEPTPEQPGIDPEIAAALANPKVKAALQQEVAQYETAGRAYADATYKNAQAAAASLLAAYPELQNISAAEIPAAIKIINQQNPQRARDIIQHIQRTNEVVSEWQKVQAAHTEWAKEDYKQKWNQFAQAEDAKFQQMVPEIGDSDTAQKFGRATVASLTSAGFSREDIARAWNGEASVSLRDARVQLLLLKSAKYDEALANMRSAQVRNVPPVQRPGVSGARNAEYGQDQIADLSNRLRQTGNVKDAAKLLLAKRANRG